MLILTPSDSAQLIETRCRPHTFTEYLFVLDNSNSVDGVKAFVSDTISYIDGRLDGSVVLALASLNEEKFNFRIISATTTNATIATILADGGATYTAQEWIDELGQLLLDGGIEKEVYRGSILVTSQTDIDKYKLYGS